MTKLEEMLRYVSENNEFYKKRIKEYGIRDPLDIMQWPILTRSELQENRYNMFSNGYKSKYFLHELRHHSSSGSLGIPVNIYWSNDDYQHSMIELWRLRARYYGIVPTDKKIMFSLIGLEGLNFEEKLFIQPRNNIIVFNRSRLQNARDCLSIIDVIDKFDPDWLYIQPSILTRLIQMYKSTEQRPPLNIKYIECVGELLPSSLKREARSIFHAKIANMYGSEENNGIALECPNGLMHVLNGNAKIEVMTSKGICADGRGQAIVTNLNNHAMPLIRYNLGDLISIKDTKCECKLESPLISVIEGRVIDTFYEGNVEINAYVLSEMVNNVQNLFNDPIKEYRFVYRKRSRELTLYISYRENKLYWAENIEKYLKSKFDEITKPNTNTLFNIKKISIEQENDFSGKHRVLLIKDE